MYVIYYKKINYRQGPIEVDLALASALEQPLANNLHLSEDSDSEEDYIPAEWEAVSNYCINYQFSFRDSLTEPRKIIPCNRISVKM